MDEDRTKPGTTLDEIAADALAAIVQSSDDAIYSKDPDTKITSWNPAAERLYGYSAEEAIGQPVGMLIPTDHRGEERTILAEVLKGNRIEHYETQRVTKDGRKIDVSISVSPVHDTEGNIVGAAIISRNISNRRQALELNDEVVQGLAVAKMAMESGDHEGGLKSVTATLQRSKRIVSRLLDEEERQRGRPHQAGDFVQESASRPL